jgi:hypothetical protein
MGKNNRLQSVLKLIVNIKILRTKNQFTGHFEMFYAN